jgi:hypothetical protein
MDAASCQRGRKPLLATPDENDSAQDQSGNPGGLFFGFFLLAKQKKETRLSVREPIPKKFRKAFHYSKAV